jgi:hypothetical protein
MQSNEMMAKKSVKRRAEMKFISIPFWGAEK